VYATAQHKGLTLVTGDQHFADTKRRDDLTDQIIQEFSRIKVTSHSFFIEYTVHLLKELSREDIKCLRDKNLKKYVQNLPNVVA